jgi:enamine deaminase RidA (YjgF/YER057c/UK114 family)
MKPPYAQPAPCEGGAPVGFALVVLRRSKMKTDKVVIPPGWEAVYEHHHYAPAVRDGDRLYCSGILGIGVDGKVSPDPHTQFTLAFEGVGLLLAAAGVSFADVVDMTTYHVDLQAHWNDFVQVKDVFVNIPYPAWTAIGVSELALPGALVEIKVIARLR